VPDFAIIDWFEEIIGIVDGAAIVEPDCFFFCDFRVWDFVDESRDEYDDMITLFFAVNSA
jgi:hypothetical protein